MNRTLTLVTVTVACVLACSPPLQAEIIGLALGHIWPVPEVLGPYDLTFSDDPRPPGEYVTDVPSPLGGEIQFSGPLLHFDFPYLPGGDFYHSDELVTMTLPADTRAFMVWVAIDTGLVQSATVIADGETAVTQVLDGYGYAACYGFYVDDPTETISTLQVETSLDYGRSVGHFGIAVPEPATFCLLALGLLARRR